MKKVKPKYRHIYLVINNVRSVLNVGSMFRTADGAGVAKIYLCGTTPTPDQHPDKIAKTALGAEKYVLWEYVSQTWRCLLKLKNQNAKIKIIGLEQSPKSKNIFDYYNTSSSYTRAALVLVVGNEVRGLSPKILGYCDDVVEIPMYGKKESLNVSVATGIALYKLRQNK